MVKESYERVEEELSNSKRLRLVRFSLLARFAIIVAVIGLMADSLVQLTEGFYALFYKDLVNIAIISLLSLFYGLGLYKLETLVMAVVYSIYLNIFVSLPFRTFYFPDFEFEPYFLKMEVIFIILTYTIGVWVSPRHMQISIALNGLFMIVCFLFINTQYSWAKYLFYFIAVTGAGLVAVRLQKEISALRESLIERSELIKKQNHLLIENNKSKDDLFKIIGHDVRGPLGQVRVLSEMLDVKDNDQEFDTAKQHMLNALNKGDSLLKDLLEWARNQEEGQEALLVPTEIQEIVDNQISQLSMSIEEKSLTVQTTIEPDSWVYADQRMLATILRNLLSNAIKFSHTGGTIQVGLRTDESTYRIYVKDEGVGMDEKTKESLLKSTTVVSRRGTAQEEGTGFGLLICNKLAQKQGGSIQIDSKINEGTTVSLILPKENV